MEKEWVQRARTGDKEAFQKIIEAHQEPLFRFAYLLLGNSQDAQDVLQEAFVRAYYRLHHFDENRPVRPWLLRIVANLARNKRRSNGRYWSALTRFARHEPTIYPNPETLIVTQSQAIELWQAIRRLNLHDQEIIYLRFFLNMTVEETAQTQGVAHGTVKSRLHRALKRLKNVILRDFPTLREDDR